MKHHTLGLVRHRNDSVVVSASTEENSINNRLYSCVDVNAAKNVGLILARRMHQCGLNEVFFDFEEQSNTNQSIQVFTKALTDSGIQLIEEPLLKAPEQIGIDYDSLSNEQKRKLYPSLIEELRTNPDWDSIKYPYSLRPVGDGLKRRKNAHQILSKVREGMVWDPFYKRMIKPEHIPSWEIELNEQRIKDANKEQMQNKAIRQRSERPEPVAKLVTPKKWKIVSDL
ncbi:Mitochondrial ribosomal protein L18 [Cichlidogyrus casuarinus]|uniref:Mitochondrial ribosomal protein L18 n=1 Tax=Cichlidogyrus casuarinus TaxID=1844966 RepID=A0ABD2Q5N3_9PLAT